MNLLTAIPKSVRRWLVIYAVAGPVLLWTKAHGWTSQTEIDLWIGLGSAFGFTAAANVVSQVDVAADPPAKATPEPLDPIVSSEGVTYPNPRTRRPTPPTTTPSTTRHERLRRQAPRAPAQDWPVIPPHQLTMPHVQSVVSVNRCTCPWNAEDADMAQRVWDWAGFCPVHAVTFNLAVAR